MFLVVAVALPCFVGTMCRATAGSTLTRDNR